MRKILFILLSIILILLIGINVVFYYENIYIKNFVPSSNVIKSIPPKDIKQDISNEPDDSINNNTSNSSNNIKQTTKRASLTFVGDVFLNGYILPSYYDKKSNKYIFDNVFDNVYQIVYSDSAFFKYDANNIDFEAADFLKNSGFDNVVLASSHIFDKKLSGAELIYDTFESKNINVFGFNKTKNKPKSKILEINGIKIGFAAFTKLLTSVSKDVYYKDYVSLLEKTEIKNELEYLKSSNCDVIIAYVNWGTEHILTPNYQQKEYAKTLIENGVDIVIGTHPHVIHPIEKISYIDQNGENKSGVVFYSLGNFFCDQLIRLPHNRFGLLANIEIDKIENKVNYKIDAIPTFIYRTKKVEGSYYDYKILYAKDIINLKGIKTSYIDYAKKIISNTQEWMNQVNKN